MLRSGITIYFVRHGETDWNRDRRYQGQKDILLNDTGRQQAARNGRVLAVALGERTAAIDYVASPLQRAQETMQILRGELGLAPQAYRTDDRLKEVHYGYWEGQLQDDLLSTDPEGCAARDRDAWGWQPRGGESYAAMSRRVARWLEEVAGDTVVVAHGGVSRALRGLLLDLPKSQCPVFPCPRTRCWSLPAVRSAGCNRPVTEPDVTAGPHSRTLRFPNISAAKKGW
jgi:probable phosphoglycerate mutase